MLKSVRREFNASFKVLLPYLVSTFVPFASIWALLRMRSELLKAAAERGVPLSVPRAPLIISCVFLPLLPLNFVGLAVLQHKYNHLVKANAQVACAA